MFCHREVGTGAAGGDKDQVQCKVWALGEGFSFLIDGWCMNGDCEGGCGVGDIVMC